MKFVMSFDMTTDETPILTICFDFLNVEIFFFWKSHLNCFAHSRPLPHSKCCMCPYVLLVERELNEMNSCSSLLHSPTVTFLFFCLEKRGDCFLRFEK